MDALLSAYSSSSSDDDNDDKPAPALPAPTPAPPSQPSASSTKRSSPSSPSQPAPESAKRLKLPPPSLPSTSSSLSTAPSPHSGRVRTFAHVEGNWATHVYISIPSSPSLLTLLSSASSLLPTLPFHPLPFPLHLSLSRTVTLRPHQLDPFTASLTSALSSIHSFPLVLSGVRVYTNDERVGSFCAVGVEGGEEVMALVRAVDGVMREWALPVYYERPSLHVTYGWRLNDVFKQVKEDAANEVEEREDGDAGQAEVEDEGEKDEGDQGEKDRDDRLDHPTAESSVVDVIAVKCKMGNRVFLIQLR